MKQLIYVICSVLMVALLTGNAVAAQTAEDGVLLSDDSSDFVLLSDAVPDAILEIRYYSTYNFVGDRIDGYEEPLAFLTKEAAAALKEVSDELAEEGYRLKIYDAYRPQMAVTNFVEWAKDADDTRMKEYFYPELDKDVLFPQGYIAEHSGHSRGSTVDLTLFDMSTEKEVDMGGTFDYFGELSHPDYTDITEEQYANRMLLRDAMLSHGFKPLEEEWWHFTLENEPYPDTYFTFPVNSDSLPKNVEDTGSASVDTITTDDFSMDYMRFGSGEDALVILPGLSVQSVLDSAEAIAQAYQLLTDDFTIYVFDQRKDMPDGYTMADMAQDTAKALQALGLDRVSVFGVSMGGMISMELACEHPELVQKLILGSTSAYMDEEHFQTIDQWIRLAKEADTQGLYLSFGEAIYPQDVFEQSEDLLIEAAGNVSAEDLHRFIILAESIRGYDLLEDLYRITCPVLIIGSEDDHVVGADASLQIADHLSDQTECEIYMYDGYGHAAYDLAPDYKERLLNFLKVPLL